MQSGVYRKIAGKSGIGMYYLFIAVAREHHTGDEAVVYVPLRIQDNWAGTVRHCYVARKEFEEKFEYVGEGLPA